MSETHSISSAVSRRLGIVQSLLIGGEFRPASDASVCNVFDPSSGQVVSTAAMATEFDTLAAISTLR